MGPFSQTVSGTAIVEKSLLNKLLSQKLHVFKALFTQDTGGHTNKLKFTVSNTYDDLCILSHIISNVKLIHYSTFEFHI